MSRKGKLIKRLKSLTKDFTFDEMDTLLGLLSFEISNKGKTSGSRVEYYNKDLDKSIMLHKPHPEKELPEYAVKRIKNDLEKEGLI